MPGNAFRRMNGRLIVFVLFAMAAAQAARAQTKEFHVVAQSATTGIPEFAHQAEIQILVSEPLVRAKRTAAVTGSHTVNEALSLLLKGTGLTATTKDGQTYTETASLPPISSKESPADANLASTTPTDTALQDIVVTATRRSEELSKVPVSISAYTQEKMDQTGIKSIADLVRFSPGVSFGLNGTNDISIRGIISSAGASTTGIYIDDTPIQMRVLDVSPNTTVPAIFDLERVEILRGPQGTLYGAGSEGGTVRYITPQPSLTTTSTYARTELSYTQYGSPNYEAGIAAGGPLIDGSLGVRASVWYRRDGGWIDAIDPLTGAVTDKNSNSSFTVVSRISALWAANDALQVTPSVIAQDREQHSVLGYWPGISNPSDGVFRTEGPDDVMDYDKYALPAIKFDLNLGRQHLISNTSYFVRRDATGYSGTLTELQFYDGVGNPAGYFPFATPGLYPLITPAGLRLPSSLSDYRAPATVLNKQDNFAQEIRLESSDDAARLKWTLGAFWGINRAEALDNIYEPQLNALTELMFATDIVGAWGSGLLPNGASYQSDVVSHDRQVALFGEASYQLIDELMLTIGARYARTNFNFNNYLVGPTSSYGLTPNVSAGSENENPTTPKVGLSYQLNSDNLFYTTWAKGFRIGGANPVFPVQEQCPGAGPEPLSYKADTTQSYEVGSKNKLSPEAWIAFSVYRIKWQSIQQTILLPTCGYQFTINTGDAIAKGFDLQGQFELAHHLTLELATGYTNARYAGDFYYAPAGATPQFVTGKGDTLGGAPWTAAAGVNYGFNLASRPAFVRADYEFASRNPWPTPAQDPGPGDSNTHFNAFAITPNATRYLSLRTGATIGPWNLTFFIDNVTNDQPLLFRNTAGYNSYNLTDPSTVLNFGDISIRPRTFGITGVYRK
jgi:iron complex outermembrane recepter protein